MPIDYNGKIKDLFENGECPSCKTPIPDTLLEGEECAKCKYPFWLMNRDDDWFEFMASGNKDD